MKNVLQSSKKAIAYLLTFAMVFTATVSGFAGGIVTAQADDATLTLPLNTSNDFNITISGNTITYTDKTNSKTVTVQISTNNNGSNPLSLTQSGSDVTFTGSNSTTYYAYIKNNTSSTVKCRINGTLNDHTFTSNDSYGVTLSINNGTTFSNFGIEYESSGGSGSDNGAYSATVTVSSTASASGEEVIYPTVQINGTDMPTQFDKNNTSSTLSYDRDESDTTVTIYIGSLFIYDYTSITINGTPYTPDKTLDGESSWFETENDWLEAFSNQTIMRSFTVNVAESYTISTVSKSTDLCYIGNFLWNYNSDNVGDDDYIDHGTLELVSFAYDFDSDGTAETYTPSTMTNAPYYGGAINWYVGEKTDSNGNGELDDGECQFPTGTVITVKLVPDAGYQLTKFTLNDFPFGATETIGQYTFTIGKGNYHLGANFTATADSVSNSATSVSSGTVSLTSGVIDAGSGQLSVKTSTDSALDTAAANSGYSTDTTLAITLDELIYKGTTDASTAWMTNISDLGTGTATVSLKLAEAPTGEDVVVLHDHNGSIETVESTYDSTTQTITFKTNSFSNFTIASKSTDTANVGDVVKAGSGASAGTYKITSSKTVTYTGTKTKGKKVTIPAAVKINGKTYKVTKIAANALKGNKKITKLTIGKNIKAIGKNAFKGCKKLRQISVKSSVLKTVKTNALKGVNSSATITIKAKTKKQYKKEVKLFKKAGAKNATYKKA